MLVILTPCIGICKLHPIHNVCIGCYRSKLELFKWSKATHEEKLEILSFIETKRELYGDLNV